MPYDARCDKYFVNRRVYDLHITVSNNHHLCQDCNIDFTSREGLKKHWAQSPRHDYCQYCDEHVDDQEEHLNESHHYCSPCQRVFRTEFELKQHYTSQSERHHYCVSCDKLFMSASNLNSHLKSSTHRSKDVGCLFRCGNAFGSLSAVFLHLENEGCSSGMTRSQVDHYVRQFDTNNIITDPSRMITSGSAFSQEEEEQEVTHIASEHSWNGADYECYLCFKVFQTPNALNQHLASPIHEDQKYICGARGCNLRFSTVSGLLQHMESDSCGVGRYRFIQNAIDRIMGRMRRLAM